MENSEITEQQKEDSKKLLETYGNKKEIENAAKKVSILDFVSTDKTRMFMNGIFYENGFAVATDGRVLIKQKTDYPAEYEGKIINPENGKEIEGQFPHYKKVFPYKDTLVDRSSRLAHITGYLSNATAAMALTEKLKYGSKNIVPVVFENTLVAPKYLQTALLYARDKGFNKVYQSDNFEIKDEPILDENGKKIFKYFKFIDKPENNLAHKYYTYDELPEEVKNVAGTLDAKDKVFTFNVKNGEEDELWEYGPVEERKIVCKEDPNVLLNRAIEFDSPDGSSILVMPQNPENLSRTYIDKDGILHNYEENTFVKTKLLGKGDDFYKNIVRELLKESSYKNADVDSLYAENLKLAEEKMNPSIFPRDKKECQIYATTLTYADAIGQNLDKNNLVYRKDQGKANLEQLMFELHMSRFKDIAKKPSLLFDAYKDTINPERIVGVAEANDIISKKQEDVQQNLSEDFEKTEKVKPLYRYYLSERPVGIGTQPKDFLQFENFDEKKFVEEAGKEAWAFVEYDHELSEKEIKEYELTPVNSKSLEIEKEETVLNDEEYAKNIADWIVQEGLGASSFQENAHISFEEIYEKTNTPSGWLEKNYDLVNDALSDHNDEELLDYNPSENEAGEFNLYFCTNAEKEDDPNTLFKQNKDGRWVRKTEEELQKELEEKLAEGMEEAVSKAFEEEKERQSKTENTKEDVSKFDSEIEAIELDLEESKTEPTEKTLEEKIYDKYIENDIPPVFGNKESYAKEIAQELSSALEEKSPVDVGTLKAHLSPTNENVSLKEKNLVKEIFEETTGIKLPEIIDGNEQNEIQIWRNITEWFHGYEQTQNVSEEIEKEPEPSKPEIQMEESKKEKPLPFSIIDNKEKGRINIKFNTNYENPQFEQIVKELKSNGWKYAPSTKQWYPVGKAVEKAIDFALKLQEKYSEKKVPEKENEVSEYKGIKFFDRNYNEPEELTAYLNEHLSTHITLAETSVILEALEHENVGLLSNRNERLGLNSENKLVVFSRREGNIDIEELNDVKHLFNYAQTKAGKDLQEIKEMQTKMQQKNPEVVNFMGSIYETAISRRESIVKQMNSIKESYFPEVAYSYDQIKAGLSDEEIKRINDETRYDSERTFIPAEEIQKWKDAENFEDFHERNLVWYKVYTLFEEYNLHEENKLLLNHHYSTLEQMYGTFNPEETKTAEVENEIKNFVPENLIHLGSEKSEDIKFLEDYAYEHDNAVLQKYAYISGYNKKPAEIMLKSVEALGYEVYVTPESKQLYIYDEQDKAKPFSEYDLYSLFELAEDENVLSKEEMNVLKEAENIYDKSYKLAKENIPYVEIPFSENSKFKNNCAGIMALSDFNTKLIETEKIMDKNEEFFSEGVSKYDDAGAYGKYADAREKGTLTPDQEYGLGSYKTDVVLHLFDGTPEMMTYSMTIDLGRIHSSIFDYVKETCSYSEVQNAINATEDRLYHSSVTDEIKTQIATIRNSVAKDFEVSYEADMNVLKELRDNQKSLRSAWIANASDISNADKELEKIQKQFAETCKDFGKEFYKKIDFESLQESSGINKATLNNYILKEIKNMIIEQTHKDSRKEYTKNVEERFDYALWHDAMKFIPENTEELEKFIQDAVKEPEIQVEHTKEEKQNRVIYSRTSYRGWEFSPKKDFSVSSYVRPFDQSDRSGFILMTGLEGKDGFWNEKVNKELLHSEGWSKKGALYKALETLSISPLTRDLLSLKPEQTFKEMVSEYSVINIDTGEDVRKEILPDELLRELSLNEKQREPNPHGVAEEIMRIENNKALWRENHKSVNEGDTIGEDSVSEVLKLSDGVFEAVLSRDMGGAGSAANYLVINKAVASKCNKNIIALAKETDGLLVFKNKAAEAYIRKELIDKKLCPLPSNNADYYERLSDYVENHPLKYISLLANTAFNFENNLKKMLEIEPEQKDILTLGKKLISMASSEEQKRIGQKILESGGKDEASMKKLFEKWSTPGIEQEKSKKKDGYPPRGES